MRKCLTAAVAVLAALSTAGVAAASTPAKPKPPKLEGEVNNKGVGKVTGGQTELEADDFYFERTFVKGKAGSEVAVTINNEGATAHTFTIDAQDIDETLQPGDSIDVTVAIPSNGKAARFYCRFHDQQGMQGAFFSKAGKARPKKASDSGGSTSSGSDGYGY
jgi:plastocyanin